MTTITLPERELVEATITTPARDVPWQTVVWDDPVNLMSYVVHVFREHFGYALPRANELMMQVHTNGHAVVAHGSREHMEMHAAAMHDYGLWATVRHGDA